MKKLLIWFFKDVWMAWCVFWMVMIWHVPAWQVVVFGFGMIISLAVKELLSPKKVTDKQF